MVAVDQLTEEALLVVVFQQTTVIDNWRYLQESLDIVHHIDWIHFQHFAIDYVYLLRWIVAQPTLQMLGIFARIQATIPQVFQRFWRRITGRNYLRGKYRLK